MPTKDSAELREILDAYDSKKLDIKLLLGHNDKRAIEAYAKNYRDTLNKMRHLIVEAEQRGVAWSIGVIDIQHSLEGNTTEADRLFKGVKNNLRDCFEHETGIDPAPNYPVKAHLTTGQKEQPHAN